MSTLVISERAPVSLTASCIPLLPLSSLSFIISWRYPPSRPSPPPHPPSRAVPRWGWGVNCLGCRPSPALSYPLFLFCFILPDNSLPQERASRPASAARSVHTDRVFSACRDVFHLRGNLFIRPVAWLLLQLSSIADLFPLSAFPPPSIVGANKAIKA